MHLVDVCVACHVVVDHVGRMLRVVTLTALRNGDGEDVDTTARALEGHGAVGSNGGGTRLRGVLVGFDEAL